MPIFLEAGAPLEPARQPIGRSSVVLTDGSRGDRLVPADIWYPSDPAATGVASPYEILPGIGFTAAAIHDASIAPGLHPLLVWSHGRTATRSTYVLLCEALAGRGFVVIAPEHAGDSLGDWMVGAAVDDATNETNRVADTRFVLDAVLDTAGPLSTIAAQVDHDRIAVAGHSYGGFTALSVASGADADPRVRAVAGLQAFTRSLPKQVFTSIAVPTLLAVAQRDATTPPASDADRAWAKLGAVPAWRFDVARAGHQACSDVGLYLELAPQVEGVPELVLQYVASMSADVTGTAGEPWRETVALHVGMLAAFLAIALDIDPDAGTAELADIAARPGVAQDHRRGRASG
jgi:dienelactone hydrolase